MVTQDTQARAGNWSDGHCHGDLLEHEDKWHIISKLDRGELKMHLDSAAQSASYRIKKDFIGDFTTAFNKAHTNVHQDLKKGENNQRLSWIKDNQILSYISILFYSLEY